MTLKNCINCSDEFEEIIRGFCRKCYYSLKWKGELNNIFKPTIESLSVVQEQVLIGSLLGDAWLGRNNTSKYPHLKIERSLKDLTYLEYEFDIFKSLCKTSIRERRSFDKRTNKWNESCYFSTLSFKVLNKYWLEWYSNKIKVVPSNLELTPLIVAIWLADDGHVCFHHKKQQLLRTTFATNSFSLNEVELLSDLLSTRYHKSFRPTKTNTNDQYVICGDDAATRAMIEDIKEIFPISMNRKSKLWISKD